MNPTIPVSDVTIREVTVVEPDDTIAAVESDLRSLDLLPVNVAPTGMPEWRMVRWVDVESYLDLADSSEDRQSRAAHRLRDLIEAGLVPTLRVPLISPDTPAPDALPMIRQDTVLIVEPGSGQLVGLLEPADFPRVARKLLAMGSLAMGSRLVFCRCPSLATPVVRNAATGSRLAF